MTVRGTLLLLGSVAAAAAGALNDWPTLTGLGGAGALLVVLARLLMGPRPRGDITVDQAALRVVRGQPAAVGLEVGLRHRRGWMRLVDGDLHAPVRSVALPRLPRERRLHLEVPLDTSVRGQAPMGPFSLVQRDPWSVVRRVVATAEGGVLTVQPRVHRVRGSLAADFSTGDAESRSRRAGDEHFHALRDYVLGDEPRSVHWRSSARAGKLVVRQQVASASSGTVIVLDLDATAYGSEDKFGSGWDDERFESAVEVAASLAASYATSTDQVHLITTAAATGVVSASAGAVTGVLDALAVVRAVIPDETAPGELPTVVRRTRCAHLVVVTGSPGPRLTGTVQRIARDVNTVVVTVGSDRALQLAGVRTRAVAGAADLVKS